MILLDPAALSPQEWAAVRNLPHLVAIAVSASAGSPIDLVFEHAAGRAAISNGINSEHPLVRAIADRREIEAATVTLKGIVIEPQGMHRPPEELLPIATEAARRVAELLRARGSELDRYAYREFVIGVARRVAEAAREGDFLGLGGRLVSDAERAAISALAEALA
jgi:hypothetical protein